MSSVSYLYLLIIRLQSVVTFLTFGFELVSRVWKTRGKRTLAYGQRSGSVIRLAVRVTAVRLARRARDLRLQRSA